MQLVFVKSVSRGIFSSVNRTIFQKLDITLTSQEKSCYFILLLFINSSPFLTAPAELRDIGDLQSLVNPEFFPPAAYLL